MSNTGSTGLALPSEQAAALEQQQTATVHSFLTSLTPEIQRALPKGLDADRMARLALTVVRKNPRLATATRESFAGAMLTAAALGLDPGLDNEAHLVPYRDRKKGVVECQLIVGYGGLVKHFWNHPAARSLDAQAVYEADEFDYRLGSDPYLRHRPALGDEDERGPVVAYYAVAQMANQATRFVVLSPKQVRRLRQGKVGTSGDIEDPEHWMERKTVLKQLLKLLPKSPQLVEVLAVDERPGGELRAQLPQAGPAAALRSPQATPQPDQPDQPHEPYAAPQTAAAARRPQGAPRAAVPGGEEASPPDDNTSSPPPTTDQAHEQAARQSHGVTPSRAQMNMLFARLDSLGVNNDDEGRRHVAAAILARRVDSFTDLTRNDVSFLLDTLAPLVTPEDLLDYLETLDEPEESVR